MGSKKIFKEQNLIKRLIEVIMLFIVKPPAAMAGGFVNAFPI